MKQLTKNKIIGIIIIMILIFGGVVGWALFRADKISKTELSSGDSAEKELFTLSATVLSVDIENNFLTVKPSNEEREIKVVLSETSQLVKLELPFDSKNLPKEGTFTPIKTEITISDFKPGDKIFLKTKEDITGKSEFNQVSFINILL